MKYTLKKPIVLWCILLMIILGVTSAYGLGESEDVRGGYQGVLAIITIRYAIIILILVTDYLVFSNLNHHVIICRYKSVERFIVKATTIEIIVIVLLALLYNVPIILLNLQYFSILIFPVILVTINMIIIALLMTSMIRFINLWFNNRAVTTGAIFIIYVGLDFLVENVNFLYVNNIVFDFQQIFILPLLLKSSQYLIVATVLLVISFFLIYLTTVLVSKKDYFLNEHES